ncbi:MutS family DNA mismatch repair protein [Mucilaginibacter gynuensis]|uniref:MutS family DNA mismatch repair protein n=1 Tax=Mucilaginibacter gynuensis TaxID=1302236 RepID=A0ABP8GVX0_9SPHI
MNNDILNDYAQRSAAAKNEADKFKKLANTYSFLRLGIFALVIAAVAAGVVYDTFTIIAVSVVILMLAFAWLVARQGKFERERDYYNDLAKINDNEADSIRTYGNLYDSGARFINEKHYYTADLDIFGKASLFQLVNRAATTPGNDKLAAWLSAPATKELILQRQEAVKELSAKKNWKLDLQARLLFAANADVNQLKRLFNYLHVPLNLPGEKTLKRYTIIAPYLLSALIIAAIFVPLVKPLAVLLALINMGIVFSKASYIKQTDLVAGKIGDTLSRYAVAFKKAEDEQWQSAYSNNLSQQLREAHTSARINELSLLINKLNYHLNIIVGVILNVFFVWDIKQIIAIEQWKRDNVHNFETSFEVLAEFEALISIAGLHINYPEWAIPQIADGDGYTLTANKIAHPLIAPGKRIANDYALNDAFKADIITGSNMAGKSTFLRTMGINTVLALCGAPVCAESMQVSVINIISYMRIKDSLNESTSTFKAELDRLQMLLGAVATEPKVFFLIDEMLRGTNSVDKYLGSKAVIEQLISKRAVGMVATHDLQIAKLEEKYPDYVRNFYFDIQVVNGEMLFDYKLKHGECKTFNASLLLKQIGIEIRIES